MSILDWISGLLGEGIGGAGHSRRNEGKDVRELAGRLGVTEEELMSIRPAYREIRVKKRSGGTRVLLEPTPELKKLQRCILHKLLRRLSAHESVHGFERGRSIVTNAQQHINKDLVISVDLKDFFPKTQARRIKEYFTFIGWNNDAADMLMRLTVWNGGLPQGAPTSPRLANLVNHAMDARLEGLAKHYGGIYSRYADDLTFSFPTRKELPKKETCSFLKMVSRIVKEHGYIMHEKEKLRVMTYARCQTVTGLVVNQKVDLPRRTRKWLRAVEHHRATGKPATLSVEQLNGWRSLRQMIVDQRRVRGG
ncbi:MAG TPA: reverse transcriptase family protein [Candidatus Ozemobacteraceae bacterium]|nr:reverse transcriptase family protein [Candidatus Ozemobacteraceae bacterium]